MFLYFYSSNFGEEFNIGLNRSNMTRLLHEAQRNWKWTIPTVVQSKACDVLAKRELILNHPGH
jgi:hypothetical protein